MKQYLLLFFTFCYSLSIAQKTEWESKRDSTLLIEFSNNYKIIRESISEFIDKAKKQSSSDSTNGIINASVFNKFIEEKFTYLSFDRGVLPVTNSASLDLLDNETRLKLAFAKRTSNATGRIHNIFGAGVIAKLGDGISEIFNGKTPTSGTTFFLNFASLSKVRVRNVTKKVKNGVWELTPFGLVLQKIDKLNSDFSDKYIYGLESKYNRLLKRWKELESEIAIGGINVQCCDELKTERDNNIIYIDSLKKAYENKNDERSKLLIDIVKIRQKQLIKEICDCDIIESERGKRIAFLYNEKTEIEKQLVELGLVGNDPLDFVKETENAYDEKLYGIYTKISPWDWYKLGWLSGGVTYTRDSYVTYDGSLALSKRFGSKDFDSWGLKLSYNWYQEKVQKKGFVRAWYANIGYEPSMINSYSNLPVQDILKTVTATTVIDTSFIFQTNKKAKDISATPYATSWLHGLNGAFTAMFFDKRNVGLNLLFQSQFSKISKPVFNSRAGIIFSLLNSNHDPDDSNSKTSINFELFLQLPDMSDVSGEGKSSWQKRVIGISTNIPFNKIFLK